MSTLRANELTKLDDTSWVGTNPTQVPTNDMIGEHWVGTEPTQVPTNDMLDLDGYKTEDELNDVGFAQSVGSVSALRLATFPASLERLWLSGYYGVGTAGGGPLYRDSADTTTADDGGMVFVDGEGVRWKRNEPGPIHTDWFGAVGDGVTEATHEIQGAFNAAANLTRDCILDEGVYVVKPNGTSSGVSYHADDTSLTFHGSLLLVAPEEDELVNGVIHFKGSNINVYEIKVDGDRTVNYMRPETSRGTQSNIEVDWKGGSLGTPTQNIRFFGGWSINALQNHVISIADYTHYENVVFDTCGEHGIYATHYAGTENRKIVIKNCKILGWGKNIQANGLSCREYEAPEIDGCTFDPAGLGWSHTQGTVGGWLKTYVQIRNCQFLGKPTTSDIYGWNGDNVFVDISDCYFAYYHGHQSPGKFSRLKFLRCLFDMRQNSLTERFRLPADTEKCRWWVNESVIREIEGADGQPVRIVDGVFENYGLPDTGDSVLRLAKTGSVFVVNGLTFYGFDDHDTNGVFRVNIGSSADINNVNFVDCASRLLRTDGTWTKLSVRNCVDVTASATLGPSFNTVPDFQSGNDL